MATETLKFEISEQDSNYELRQYKEYLTASIEIEAGFIDALNSGFRILSDYYAGSNWSKTPVDVKGALAMGVASHEKISTTTPVLVKMVVEGEKYEISFILPAKYTKDNIPEPFNKNIKFSRVKPCKAAVIMNRGHMDDAIAIEKASDLRSWVEQKGVRYKSKIIFAVFLSLLTPSRFRRWEVLTKVDDALDNAELEP